MLNCAIIIQLLGVASEPSVQLPTVEIAVHLQINPNTVNRAYIELEREGLCQVALQDIRRHGRAPIDPGGTPCSPARRWLAGRW